MKRLTPFGSGPMPVIALLLLAACDSTTAARDAGPVPTGDTGPRDTGPRADAWSVDAAIQIDAFVETDAGNDAAAPPSPTFRGDVFPLFARCMGCHGTRWGGTDPDIAHAALMAGGQPRVCTSSYPARTVTPGSPSESLLINKLTGDIAGCGEQMPALRDGEVRADRPFFSAAEVDVVRAWIAAGALND